MLFTYKAIDQTGNENAGSIDALNMDVAISAIQRRGLTIVSIKPAEEKTAFQRSTSWFVRVSNKDIVVLSRQIATLFEAQVSALRVFRLLSEEAENKLLASTLAAVAEDLQSGSSISRALGKHPKIFSKFYVNMVLSGEESGKLDQVFNYLADYLDRTYEVASKAKNALIYPAFVVFTFVTVMILMLTMVIPRISAILLESGQDIPLYTRVVIAISNFFINYGIFIVFLLIVGVAFLIRFLRTEAGKASIAQLQLDVPYIGGLYRKLYLSRIADNMNTMLLAGIPMVKVIEITASVVGNPVYEGILARASDKIKTGSPLSEAISGTDEVPSILIQMIKVGEETGELGNILKTLANFYRREVTNAVDTLVDLIEPVMIVMLGLGVGILLASVLIPIYNISSAI